MMKSKRKYFNLIGKDNKTYRFTLLFDYPNTIWIFSHLNKNLHYSKRNHIANAEIRRIGNNNELLILALGDINLEFLGISKKGIGMQIIDQLELFAMNLLDKEFIFVVQPDMGNSSEIFYRKCGFKSFMQSKRFSKEIKSDIIRQLDDFNDVMKPLFKIVKKQPPKKT